MRRAAPHGLVDQTQPAEASQIGEELVRNLGAGVRPARIATDAPQQRTCAVAVADSIEHPLHSPLMRVGLEERRSAPIAQRLEHHADAGGRIVRAHIRGHIPKRRNPTQEVKLVTERIETPDPAAHRTAHRHDLESDAPRTLPAFRRTDAARKRKTIARSDGLRASTDRDL